jgi:hypothetical protein
MAYGAGRSRLFAERGREQASERKEYEAQLAAAENARAIQSKRKAGWSLFGKAVGSLLGPGGIVVGDILGKTIGDLGTVGGKQAEDYDIAIDVGKFGVSKQHDYADVQAQLDRADEGEFWQDVTDVGQTALSSFKLGGGSLSEPGKFSFTQYGGHGSDTGYGVFGKGKGGLSLWDKWMGYYVS